MLDDILGGLLDAANPRGWRGWLIWCLAAALVLVVLWLLDVM